VSNATTCSPRTRRTSGSLPNFIFHESFTSPTAEKQYATPAVTESGAGYMPDEVTRATARCMHYAAYRWRQAENDEAARRWQQRYFNFRDQVVLGNRKLIYRAVSKRPTPCADDLIGECQIVLIQAVAAYNPWLGIRFSTYAFTCLMRALARLAQRQASDRLARSLSLDALPMGEPRDRGTQRQPTSGVFPLDEYLQEGHALLSSREKTILRRRFCLGESDETGTLEEVGRELGLSKERVRQVQATALNKLRRALLAGTDRC
jgi:RNA polymerase sigma factor (sigma-70 family)